MRRMTRSDLQRSLDEKFMRMAIAEASKAAREGNAPIGAVITKNNRVVARGHNGVFTGRDVAAHAEIVAIRKLTRKTRSFDLKDFVLYSVLEPCAMCQWAALRTDISRIVYGAKHKDVPQFSKGILKKADQRVQELAKTLIRFGQVLEEDCKKLLAKALPD